MTLLSIADLLMAPFWLVATWLLLTACWRLGARIAPSDDGLGHILHTLVLSWAAIVLVSFSLSAVNYLTPWLLVTTVGAGAALAIQCMRRPPMHAGGGVAVADGAGPLALRWLFLRVFSARNQFPAAAAHHDCLWVVGWLWYGSLAAAVVVEWGLLRFITDWDSLAYHMPFVDQWLRAKSLNTTHSSSWFHPGNSELLGLWCTAPFSGDFLLRLANVVPAVILAMGTRELARRLGARSATAHLSAFAAITTSVATQQLLDYENDVAAAALFIASMAYGIRCARRARRGHLLLWAASLGLLPGVKYYALGYAAVAGVGVALLVLWRRGVKSALCVAAAGMAGAVLLSSYWYIRNYQITGTPLYPQGVAGSANLLAEVFPDLHRTTVSGNHDPRVVPLLLRAVWNRLGALNWAAWLAIPITTAWLIARGFWGGAQRRWSGHALLVYAILGCFFVFSVTPFVVEVSPGTCDMLEDGYLPSRFLLCTVTLAVVALGICLDAISVAIGRKTRSTGTVLRNILRWLFGLAALSQLCLARHWRDGAEALEVVLAGNALFFLIAVTSCAPSRLSSLRTTLLWRHCALLGCSLAISALGGRWHAGFARFYDQYYSTRLFSQLESASHGNLRLCVLMYRGYPFFGSRRQFDIFGPVCVPTFGDLERYLLYHRPDRVITIKGDIIGPHRYDRIAEWMWEHQTYFKQTYSDYRFTVYQARASIAHGVVTPDAEARW